MGAKGCLWASRTSTTSRRPGTTSCCRSTTRSCAYSVARSTLTVAPDRAGGHQPACELELLSISRRDQSFATSNRNRERERGVQPPPENLGGPKLFPAPLPGPALSPAGHSQGGRTLSARQAGPARDRAGRVVAARSARTAGAQGAAGPTPSPGARASSAPSSMPRSASYWSAQTERTSHSCLLADSARTIVLPSGQRKRGAPA
jgi:hypothetical protein